MICIKTLYLLNTVARNYASLSNPGSNRCLAIQPEHSIILPEDEQLETGNNTFGLPQDIAFL